MVAMPKTPEQWLEHATSTEKKKGIFKVFLGYAPGVGKTYSMLSEAIRRKNRGEDVVIGVIETHGRKGVIELVDQLEKVPRRQLNYKGTTFEEMDYEAIIARKPQVVLIDELAHTNVEGSKHRKRYEDVFEVLNNNIDVLSTMNVQHLESVTPTVRQITDIQVRETVPDWVLRKADEVVMIDVTPEALQTRMRRGDIYPQERVERSLTNFFRRGNLIALRELALRQVAGVVDRHLISYMEGKKIDENWGVRERIAVCISSNPAAKALIARSARMAEAIDAELYVVYVDVGSDESPDDQRTLNDNIRFAESFGATIEKVKGTSVAKAVANYVRDRRITEVVFGRSAVKGWRRFLYLSAIQKFLRDAPPVDVHIVTQEE
jgi:two-component system, OmpR family, sensor histidine kinase KdpD